MRVLAIFEEETEEQLLEFLRRETPRMSTLRRVIVAPEQTEVQDVNRVALRFPGIAFGHPLLPAILKEVGASFDPGTLKATPSTPQQTRDYIISARYPWAHDRIA